MTRKILFLILLSILGATSGFPDDQESGSETFVVGIKETPPFTFKDEDGSWSGPVVWLVNNVVEDLGQKVEFKESTLEDLFSQVSNRDLDAGAAALSINADREEKIDFTPPFYTSGIGIATRIENTELWALALRVVFSWQFLQGFFGLLTLLAAVGFLVWLAERKVNRAQFGGRPAAGIGNGLWYSAVTMTTVGYGDKTPKTVPGRAIGLVWMFLATIIISGFTAGFASSLTRDSINKKVEGPSDLGKVPTGTVPDSTSALWLDHLGIPFSTSEDIEDLLQKLENGELGAVVFDKPVLEYYAGKNNLQRVQVLNSFYSRENYAFILPEKSDYRERFDVLLLEATESDQWKAELLRVLNTSGSPRMQAP